MWSKQRGVFLVVLIELLTAAPLWAALVTVDTDALTITGGGYDITGSVDAQGIAQFIVGGDFVLNDGDMLVGTGGRAASLLVGNDVYIDSSATIDFSAIGTTAGAGGGGGSLGGIGGTGGTGSAGGAGGFGGFGGFGSIGFPTGGIPPFPASSGYAGGGVQYGTVGTVGQTGHSGQSGFNASGSGGTSAPANADVQPQGTFSLGGTPGDTGLYPPIPIPLPPPLGDIAGFLLPGELSSNGKDAGNGTPGLTGSNGTAGITGGDGLNSGDGFELSGGGGGAGGGGGNGGQGGTGGGGGGGGGGGQGGYAFGFELPPTTFSVTSAGGTGAPGGHGGNGGQGGSGGSGGNGGSGGGGGGAFEIRALGRITVDGSAMARGGNGVGGDSGGAGTFDPEAGAGESGVDGFPIGSPGWSTLVYVVPPAPPVVVVLPDNTGSGGGDGGTGGSGGLGGTGGAGGAGGGGAGGTVKLVGSVVDGSGTIDTSGGLSGNGANQAQDGRFLLGTNATSSFSAGTTANSTMTRTGSRSLNPFVAGMPLTPNIPGLVDGAEAYGFLDANQFGADILQIDGDPLLNGVPMDAVAGLVRLDVGPDGFTDDYDGFDLVLLFNARSEQLTDVRFGAGVQKLDGMGVPTAEQDFEAANMSLAPIHAIDLLAGGWVNDPVFGGLGDMVANQLDGFEVYATLVPEDTPTSGLNFGMSVTGAGGTYTAFTDKLENGQFLFAQFDPSLPVYTATWNGGTGYWNEEANWATLDELGGTVTDPGDIVPSNTTAVAYNVLINSGNAQVNQDMLVTIDTLTIGATDELTILDGERLILEKFGVRSGSGVIDNNGTIMVGAQSTSSNETALRFSGSSLLLTGSGLLTTTDDPDNEISSLRSTDSLIQDTGHTIEAVGRLGGNSLLITNKGTIRPLESSNGNALIIDPAKGPDRESPAFINEGSIQADGSMRSLTLLDGYFENKSLIEATNGGKLELDTARIRTANGMLQALGGDSELRITGATTLEDGEILVDGGLLHIDDASLLTNRGMIRNVNGDTRITDSTIDNYGGTIEGGSNVTFEGDVEIRGGTLTGVLASNQSSTHVTLEDVNLDLTEGAFPANFGTLTFRQKINFQTDAVFSTVTDTIVDGDATITGNLELTTTSLVGGSGSGGDLVLRGSLTFYGSKIGTTADETAQPLFIDGDIIELIGPVDWNLGGSQDPGDVRFVNNILQADSVTFHDGTIDNRGGYIEASNNLTLNNVLLIGGEIYGSGTIQDSTLSQVTFPYDYGSTNFYTFMGSNTLDRVTVPSDAELELNDASVQLVNGLTNDGTVTLNGGSLDVLNDLAIDGTGYFTINDAFVTGSGTLTVGSGQTVSVYATSAGGTNLGRGQDQTRIVNNGFIIGAEGNPGAAILEPGDTTELSVNNGVIASVTLASGQWEGGGQYDSVVLQDVIIQNGSIEAEIGSGESFVDTSSTAILWDVAVHSDLTVQGTLSPIGRIDGDGIITFEANSALAIDEIGLGYPTDVTIDGVTLDFQPGSTIAGDSSRTLTIGPNATVTGLTDWVGGENENAPTIINQGTLTLDSLTGGDVTKSFLAGTTISKRVYLAATGGDPTGVDPSETVVLENLLQITGPQLFTNTGVINSDSGTLEITDAALNNSGGQIDANAVVTNSMISNFGGSVRGETFDGVSLSGGSLFSSNSTTTLVLLNNASSLTDVTSDATIQSNGVDLSINGSVEFTDFNTASQFINNSGAAIQIDNATLTVGGNVTNDGDITVENGGVLTVNAVLPGGAAPAAFTGFVNNGTVIIADASATFQGVVDNEGTLQIGDGGTTGSIAGDIVNNGSLIFNHSDGNTFSGDISGTGDLTKEGTGALVLTGDNSSTGVTTINQGSLTIGDGGTAGSIAGDIVNSSIEGFSLAFNRSDDVAYAGVISGNGALLQLGSGTLTLTGNNTYLGNTLIDIDATLLANNSEGSATGSGVVLVNGTLGGTGSIAGMVVSNHATVAPGASVGTLTVGTIDLRHGAALAVELAGGGDVAGTDFDQLVVTNSATLGGNLAIDVLGVFLPDHADLFTVLTASSLTGAFANVADGGRLAANIGSFLVEYDGTTNAVVLSDFLTGLAGDYNNNGTIDAADYTVWRDALEDGSITLLNDPTSGIVDESDFTYWRAHFGETLGSGAAAGAKNVPEPSTLVLVFAASLALFLYRRATDS